MNPKKIKKMSYFFKAYVKKRREPERKKGIYSKKKKRLGSGDLINVVTVIGRFVSPQKKANEEKHRINYYLAWGGINNVPVR